VAQWLCRILFTGHIVIWFRGGYLLTNVFLFGLLLDADTYFVIFSLYIVCVLPLGVATCCVTNIGNTPTTEGHHTAQKEERKAHNNCLRKTSNNNRRKTKSLHCPQPDHHDADGLAGHKTWRTTQTTTRRYKYTTQKSVYSS
jgi:hypothetical protein